MTNAPSHLINAGHGVIRVLRLFAASQTYALRYEVHPDEDMCQRCGCTEVFGCPEGCSWVNATHTLCSACLEKLLLP